MSESREIVGREGTKGPGPSNEFASFVHANIDDLQNIPEPGVEWRFSDVEGVDMRVFKNLNALGALSCVGRDEDKLRIYRTPPVVYQRIQEVDACRDRLPCGHGGMQNVPGETDPGYSCGHDDCEARYSRAEVEEVLR